eukprot:767656-Hanusia_phi.AAC.5
MQTAIGVRPSGGPRPGRKLPGQPGWQPGLPGPGSDGAAALSGGTRPRRDRRPAPGTAFSVTSYQLESGRAGTDRTDSDLTRYDFIIKSGPPRGQQVIRRRHCDRRS